MGLKDFLTKLAKHRSGASQKLVQEKLDVYQLSLLVEMRRLELACSSSSSSSSSSPSSSSSQQQRDELVNTIRGRSFERQKESLVSDVHAQVLGLFTALHETCEVGRKVTASGRGEGDGDGAPQAKKDKEGRPADPNMWDLVASRAAVSREREVRLEARVRSRHDALRERLGFCVRVGPSSIQGGGRGLVLDGAARAGTVIGLYPGTVHLPHHLAKLKTSEAADNLFGAGNDNLLSRYDGTVIDAAAWSTGQDGANPFAAGQFINHPPPGVPPNVMPCSYNFPSDTDTPAGLPSHLRPYVTNRYNKEPGMLGLMHTNGDLCLSLAFVLTRDMDDGTELFANYRLNPKIATPDWYTAVDPEQDARRWG